MGTNYYATIPNESYHKDDISSRWEAPYRLIHLGKSSWGWCFALKIYPEENIIAEQYKYCNKNLSMFTIQFHYHFIQVLLYLYRANVPNNNIVSHENLDRIEGSICISSWI